MSFRTVFHLPGSPVPGAEIGYNLKDCTTFFPGLSTVRTHSPRLSMPGRAKEVHHKDPGHNQGHAYHPRRGELLPKGQGAITEVATMPTALQVA